MEINEVYVKEEITIKEETLDTKVLLDNHHHEKFLDQHKKQNISEVTNCHLQIPKCEESCSNIIDDIIDAPQMSQPIPGSILANVSVKKKKKNSQKEKKRLPNGQMVRMTSKMRRLNNNEIFVFLDKLQNYPVIWNMKCKAYTNKYKRNAQIELLLTEFIKVGIIMHREEFKTKLKSIKDTYRVELNKVKRSMKSGAVEEDVYVPKLSWYAKADSFLREVTSARESFSTMEPRIHVMHGENDAVDELDEKHPLSILNYFSTNEETETTQAAPNEETREVEKPRERARSSVSLGKPVQDAMNHVDRMAKVPNSEDENYNFGRYVTSQLRALPPIWSVTLKTEIQHTIEKVVLQSLSGQPHPGAITFSSLLQQSHPTPAHASHRTSSVNGHPYRSSSITEGVQSSNSFPLCILEVSNSEHNSSPSSAYSDTSE